MVLSVLVGSFNSLWKYSNGTLVVSITYWSVLLHLILATSTVPLSLTIFEIGFVCQNGVKTTIESVPKNNQITKIINVCFLIFFPNKYTSKLFFGQSFTHSIQLIQSE
jgi:hypothetical protein